MNRPVTERARPEGPRTNPTELLPESHGAPSRSRGRTAFLVLLTVLLAIGWIVPATSASALPSANAPAVPGAIALPSSDAPASAPAVATTPVSAAAPTSLGNIPTVPLSSIAPLPLSAFGPVSTSSLSPSPQPAGASTASNWYVQNYAQTGNTIQLGGSSQDLATAATSVSDLTNLTTGSTFYETHGYTTVSVSHDGGTSWTSSWPGQATNWTDTKSANYGDLLGWPVLDPLYTTGAEPTNWVPSDLYGFQPKVPQIAATPDGKSLVLLSAYAGGCFELFSSTCEANVTALYDSFEAAEGIAVSVSTNGGTTWSAPIPIVAAPQVAVYDLASACGSTAAGYYIVPLTQVSSMALAVDPSGNAYVAYTMTTFQYLSSAYLVCNSGALDYNWGSILFSAYVDSSSTPSTSWGSPTPVALFNWTSTDLQSGIPYNPMFDQPTMAVGPAPTDEVYAMFGDLGNATVGGNRAIGLVTTSNQGSTWTKFADVTGLLQDFVRGTPPDWFYNNTGPVLAIDNSSSSSYEGNMYLVWSDNRSATQTSGYPSIAFSRNTGSGWSSPIYLSPDDPSSLLYADPTVSVQPNGDLWVGYYGINPTNGNYHVYGIYSTDGGTDWSSQFVVSDTPSAPGSGSSLQAILGEVSIAATSAGALYTWEDCRSSDCQWSGSSGDNTTEFSALVVPFSITSSAAGITATVTVGGVATSDALPATLGVDVNSSVTVSVPTWVATPNGTYIQEFADFSGIQSCATDPLTFTATGSGTLTANFVLSPGSWLQGTVAPLIAGARLTVVEVSTGQTVAANLLTGATSYSFNVTVPGGQTYRVSASAPNYQQANFTGGTSDFTTTTVTLTLVKELGTLVGTVTLSTGTADLQNVTVYVNGTSVASIPGGSYDAATGRFTAPEEWGQYYLNVTASPVGGYTTFSKQIVIQAASTTTETVALEGAWIDGTVTPYPVTVTVNGVSIASLFDVNGGTASWVDALPGGTYDIYAPAAGYSTYNETYTVKAGDTLNLSGAQAIKLTDTATIDGNITPAQTSGGNVPALTINGATFNVLDEGTYGTFTASVVATSAPVEIVVKLLGYVTNYTNLTVTPGTTYTVDVHLSTVPPPANCTTTNTCTTTPNCSATNSCPKNTTGVPVLDYVGIGIIVVIVIAAAAVLLSRRGGGAKPMPPSPGATSPEASYGSPSSSSTMGSTAGMPSEDAGSPPAPPPQ